MSSCIKDLFDFDLVKKCPNCENISLKSKFHKDKNREDGLQPYCVFLEHNNILKSERKQENIN